MKAFMRSLSATKSLAAIILVSLITGNAYGAAKLTLKGNAGDAKYASDSEVRISLIDWSDAPQQAAVEQAYQAYLQDHDLEAFLGTLEAQDTRGYLFTAAATGYRIKYAWQAQQGDKRRMSFLVLPGLKTRNPYLWNTPNAGESAFSLVQVELNDGAGTVKTSLEGEIGSNDSGRLVLENADAIKMFATIKDDTPYYLK